ncbi:MAG: hypothetical protein J6M95_04760 [Bacilli bacterium]|nr:hypothetical protein [Bacilli bacterium]
MIEVREVKSKKEMKAFVKFPLDLYKGCPYYVPSLTQDEINITSKKKNLSLGNSKVKCFLAFKDGALAGRIAGIIALDSNKKNNEKAIRFSRIDMIDDVEVTEALLKAVSDWGKENGLEFIQGPWGFDDADREGMLTFGYEEYSSYATAYSYPYYKEHMEKLGYEKESEWVENRLFPNDTDPRFPKVAEMLRKRGYHDLSEDMKPSKIVKKYADQFFECYNKAYAELDNFVPVDERQKKSMLNTFAVLLNQKYFSVIVNDKDEVVAFGVGLPYVGDAIKKARGNLYRALPGMIKAIKNPRKVELALIGVDPIYRNSGVHALVADRLIKYAKADNLDDIFLDPTLTTNLKMLNTWQGMAKQERCRRQTYRKNII